jgi:hypothetical protein
MALLRIGGEEYNPDWNSADGNPEILNKPDTGSGSDTTAIHDDTAGEIHAITSKATPVSADELAIEDSAASWAKKRLTIGQILSMATVPMKKHFETYDPSPARGSESNIHGGILSLATAQPLDSVPTNIVVTKGIGKILIVINAGGDVSGSITVTGNTIDRSTQVITPADTDTITVDALTTDTSDTDANSNQRHAFNGAYITSKWFYGTVTLSTADLTLTDVDVYHVSFEQFGDVSGITLDAFDANLITTNASAEFDAYLYALEVTGDKCNITRQADLNVGAGGITALANKYERLRAGNLNKALDGTTDGIWVDVHYSTPAYVEDVTLKVHYTHTIQLTF